MIEGAEEPSAPVVRQTAASNQVSDSMSKHTAPMICVCGEETESRMVDVTMFTDRGLVLIENVPVRICNACQEQYYEKDAAFGIQELVSKGFPKDRAVREITVPVYSLSPEAMQQRLPENIES